MGVISHVGSDLGEDFWTTWLLGWNMWGLMEEAMEYFLIIKLGKKHHRRQSISLLKLPSLFLMDFHCTRNICWCLVGLVMLHFASSEKFAELFQPEWALDHFSYEGELLRLQLDRYSGAGFSSKNKYMFGKVSLQIKLIDGDSAGTVTAFYMSSDGPNRNEFDFEFLGNSTGEPYSVQTNLYVNGVGNREQRLNLWFDPTKDFHSYSIFWDQRHIVFLVDETPIRVHPNMEFRGIPFPKDQPMRVHSSIWNADEWATQGGRVKTDWSHAPFVASYKGFEIAAYECSATAAAVENSRRCSSSGEKNHLSELSSHQTHQLLWVRANHMVYDYCSDSARFPTTPAECLHHRHH